MLLSILHCSFLLLHSAALPLSVCLQAKDALNHAYFADLDKETIDLLENPAISERDD